MSNKTCGECKHHGSLLNLCCRYADADYPGVEKGCKYFEPKVITNGDVIRQMSNAELAKMLSNPCSMCVYNVDLQCERIDCEQNIEAWLNAPADCVKQNSNDDTQTDLCKADNTESEEKDE